MPPCHPPTSEQSRAVDLFKTSDSLKINAFAGTGKTTTLEYLDTDPQRILPVRPDFLTLRALRGWCLVLRPKE